MEGRKDVFAITESSKEEKKAYWTKIGSAFPNKDGSLSVLLNAFPVNGRMNIRDPKPDAERVAE